MQEETTGASQVAAIPIRGYNQYDYPRIIDTLVKAGIVHVLGTPALCVNGLFGVPKGPDKIRLIFDGRRANLFFDPCPPVALISPTDLADILVACPDDLVCGKSDVSAMYHRFRVPDWMADYFGLPSTKLPDGSTGYPRIVTLPMGFSHAVFIAHTIHSTILRLCLGSTLPQVIGETEPVQLNKDSDSAMFWYIDDPGFLSCQPRQIQSRMRQTTSTLNRYGLVIEERKTVWPATSRAVELLGIAVISNGWLLPSATKLASLWCETCFYITKKWATSKQLSSLIGKWVWFCLLNRPLLSVFQAVYAFISSNHVSESRLPNEVIEELSLMVKLIPFLAVNLRAPASSLVLASDASLSGAGVTYAQSDQAVSLLPFSLKKGWWSSLEDGYDVSRHLAFPKLVEDFIDSHAWTTVICHRFRFADNIVILEGQACLLALRWFLSSPARFGSRLPFFLDSQALLGALVKGRSSSHRLNRVCRKIAAHVLAGNLRIAWIWVPSSKNPADGPSRFLAHPDDE
jgi:hypothetical protein